MTDTVDPETRSRIMSRVRGRDTTSEMAVRRAVHRAGFRYRLHRRDLPGRPDLVLPRYKTVVFVHGCFWHWHGCPRSRMPSSNVDYWKAKIERNVQRDKAAVEALTRSGWRVHVIWECDLDAGIENLLRTLREHQIGD